MKADFWQKLVSCQSEWTQHLYHPAFLASSTLYHNKHEDFPRAVVSDTGEQIRLNPSHNHFRNNKCNFGPFFRYLDQKVSTSGRMWKNVNAKQNKQKYPNFSSGNLKFFKNNKTYSLLSLHDCGDVECKHSITLSDKAQSRIGAYSSMHTTLLWFYIAFTIFQKLFTWFLMRSCSL